MALYSTFNVITGLDKTCEYLLSCVVFGNRSTIKTPIQQAMPRS